MQCPGCSVRKPVLSQNFLNELLYSPHKENQADSQCVLTPPSFISGHPLQRGHSAPWGKRSTSSLLPVISESKLRGSLHLSEESSALSALVSPAFHLLTQSPELPLRHLSSGLAEQLMSTWISSMWWQEAGPQGQLAALGAGTVTGVQRDTSSPCHSIWLPRGHLCPFKRGPCCWGAKVSLTPVCRDAPGRWADLCAVLLNWRAVRLSKSHHYSWLQGDLLVHSRATGPVASLTGHSLPPPPL